MSTDGRGGIAFTSLESEDISEPKTHTGIRATAARTTAAATASAATGVVDRLAVVHLQRKRQHHHHHQRKYQRQHQRENLYKSRQLGLI